MWKSFKVKVEPLTPEAFAPFGEVIETFEEARTGDSKGRIEVSCVSRDCGSF